MLAIINRVEGTDAALCIVVFVALRLIANDTRRADGPFSATVSKIAHSAGVSYNTAAKALRILRGIGVIEVATQRIAGTAANAPSLYTFPTMRGTPSPIIWGDLAPNVGETFPTATPPRDAEISKELEITERTKNQTSGAGAVGSANSATQAEQVGAIWEAYPRKVGHSQALAAIATALSTTPAAELRAAVTAYAAAVAKWDEADRRFIPHPAKWFGEERFKDDPATWVRTAASNARTGIISPADHAGGF